MEYFNEAQKKTVSQRLHMLKLTNSNDNYRKWNIERLCNKPRITNEPNKFRNQRHANIITNSSNSYNAICRRQLLYKLDRLIAQKMIALQKIHMIKSANLNHASKNSKSKIEQHYEIWDNPSYRSHKRLVNVKLSSVGLCYFSILFVFFA